VNRLPKAVDTVLTAQKKSGKPLAVILAGHNGSGKSTMWYERGLANRFEIPLVNADRMMLSILPESSAQKALPSWASKLRDNDISWMKVAQKGVEAFVVQAMAHNVPFAMETVFSHWKELADGSVQSKIDLIREMQRANYFVLLFFVGLSSTQLSIGRVFSRVQAGGHNVEEQKLKERFPRTQKAVGHATSVADAAILVDNSLDPQHAFAVCRIQLGSRKIYDCRDEAATPPQAILQWLNVVSPLDES
jgi:predicted ABC-type ATPase